MVLPLKNPEASSRGRSGRRSPGLEGRPGALLPETDCCSLSGRPSNSWAVGAVDTAAVLCQALGLRKRLQRHSSGIPEPPRLLVLLKEQPAPVSGPFLSSL